MNQSALRALHILEYVSERGAVGLADISDDLALNKSTVHRFLTALVRAGYVRRDGGRGRYALTTKILTVANQVLEGIDVRNILHPILETCAKDSNETAHLAVLEDNEIVYIDKVEGRRAIHMASRIGARGLCHSTALGKVLLGHRPEEEWKRYVEEKGLTKKTANTVLDPTRFYEELKRARSRGYAIDNIENETGIRCVAAPVHDHTGLVICAISISGWTVSVTRTRLEELVPLALSHAARASEQLGYGEGSGRR